MTTTSGLALTVSATRRGAGKEASAHLSSDESQAMIPPLILELSGRISRWAALLEGAFIDPAHSSDDVAALAWMQQSLEDVEATIIGLLEANRRSAAFQGPALSFARSLVPLGSAGPTGRLAPGSWCHAGGLSLLRSMPGTSGVSQSTDHRPESKDS